MEELAHLSIRACSKITEVAPLEEGALYVRVWALCPELTVTCQVDGYVTKCMYHVCRMSDCPIGMNVCRK